MSVPARLLNRRDAAAYCGLPVRNFAKNIRIRPIRLGPHELWDRAELDRWIDAMKGGERKTEDWADAVAKF